MTTQVHIQVGNEKKRKWEDAVDSSIEYNNLSDLIRLSVEREIAGENTEQQASIEAEGALSEILDGIDQLQNGLSSIDSRLVSVEEETRRDPKTTQIATKVFGVLPTKQPGTSAWEEEKQTLLNQYQAAEVGAEEVESKPIQADLDAWEGTIEGLSRSLGVPRGQIRNAIKKLQEDTQQIRETEDGRYYKVAKR